MAGRRWRARIGVVLQSWRDHGKWRVRELLAHLGSYYAPYSSPETSRPWDTDELIAPVGLTEHADKRVRQLSGGQRRRLDVAIGIVGRPELLFLDEPTAGFDPEARREFHDLVHRLADREEATILLTTHDLDEAEKLADRILILAGGTIIADGSADELSRRMSTQAEVRWSRDGQRFVHSAGRADPVRPRAVPAVRRVRRGPRGAPGQPGGHLHGAGPAGRDQGPSTLGTATRSGSSRWWPDERELRWPHGRACDRGWIELKHTFTTTEDLFDVC